MAEPTSFNADRRNWELIIKAVDSKLVNNIDADRALDLIFEDKKNEIHTSSI